MVAGQRLVASDGKEVMLFPLPAIYISQGEYETFSHSGIPAIDFLGWNNGRVYEAPMYAPCSCKCVATIDINNNGRVFQSLDQVHTPNGLKYVNFMFFHDNNPIANVGQIFVQGQLIGHTGTAGYVTGDHTHFNCANGNYAGWENVPPDNNGELINSTHVYDICYTNDTAIVNGYGYNWQEFNGGITPGNYKKHKFNFIFYNARKRNLRRLIY